MSHLKPNQTGLKTHRSVNTQWEIYSIQTFFVQPQNGLWYEILKTFFSGQLHIKTNVYYNSENQAVQFELFYTSPFKNVCVQYCRVFICLGRVCLLSLPLFMKSILCFSFKYILFKI